MGDAITRLGVDQHRNSTADTNIGYIVEPANKGHFGKGYFVLSLEVVPISEVHHNITLIVYQHYMGWIT